MLAGDAPGRTADDEMTVFESLGLAVEDLAAAEYLVRRAGRDRHRHVRRVLIPLAEIERARERIVGAAVRTPLVRLPDTDIWLKLENLQPVGSFKIRGATNAIRAASTEELAGGVVTASAGNMAQGVAWAAREAGVPATIVVPDHAPQTKLDRDRAAGRTRDQGAVRALVADDRRVAIRRRRGRFVHPVEDELVMAGNGTIGLELIEDLPDVDTVLVPFGGGGLSTGIASAVKALRPAVRVYGVDPETGPALSRAFAAGSRSRWSMCPRSSTGPAAAGCSSRCGRTSAPRWTGRTSPRSTRPRTPCGYSGSACA